MLEALIGFAVGLLAGAGFVLWQLAMLERWTLRGIFTTLRGVRQYTHHDELTFVTPAGWDWVEDTESVPDGVRHEQRRAA